MENNTLSLEEYQNVVILYRDEEGALYIGNTYNYHGRTPESQFMSIMYRESLDETKGIMAAWNYLDDHSPTITLVPESEMSLGVEDFLTAHQADLKWDEIEYHEVTSYPKIETYVRLSPVRRKSAIGFVMK
ncbi:MAG: hypothetical protein MR283_05910 [Erysipelotrichaceae bacterium]|nr:hypothetical protein [Erysipelotrichaceae bacterium]MDY6035232.1 hypothetical protein [Bulleidia sp.]